MKYFFCSFVIFIFLSNLAQAQFESIDLNKYKLTDYKYKTLNTNLSLNNVNQYINSNSNTNQNNLTSGGNLSYSSTKYSRKYYGNQSIWFSISNSFESNYTNTSRTTRLNNRLNSSLGINSTNHFYLANNYFVGVNFRTIQYPEYSYSKLNNPYYNISGKFNSMQSQNSVSLQIGKGRIEDVSDARLAIYILDDLLKQGRLSRTPSEEEVFTFADFITKTLNKRVIDSRIKRIKEFVAVDSFLVSNGLSNKTDGLYFGLINDNWNYGRFGPGETGSEWYLGVSPSLDYLNRFNKNTTNGVISKDRNGFTKYGIGVNADYHSSWISGLKWQKGYDVWGSFNIFKYDTVGNYHVSNIKVLSGSAGYHLSYLPNTRTSITFSNGIRITKYLWTDFSDVINIEPYISGSCYYYFSEKLRLQVNTNVNYNFNKKYDPMSTTKTLDFGFSATLSYYIF